jgi:hypothetical protein
MNIRTRYARSSRPKPTGGGARCGPLLRAALAPDDDEGAVQPAGVVASANATSRSHVMSGRLTRTARNRDTAGGTVERPPATSPARKSNEIKESKRAICIACQVKDAHDARLCPDNKTSRTGSPFENRPISLNFASDNCVSRNQMSGAPGRHACRQACRRCYNMRGWSSRTGITVSSRFDESQKIVRVTAIKRRGSNTY